jgi:hypothetical protein
MVSPCRCSCLVSPRANYALFFCCIALPATSSAKKLTPQWRWRSNTTTRSQSSRESERCHHLQHFPLHLLARLAALLHTFAFLACGLFSSLIFFGSFSFRLPSFRRVLADPVSGDLSFLFHPAAALSLFIIHLNKQKSRLDPIAALLPPYCVGMRCRMNAF